MHRTSAHAAVLNVSTSYRVADNLITFANASAKSTVSEPQDTRIRGISRRFDAADGDAMDHNKLRQRSHPSSTARGFIGASGEQPRECFEFP
jgi:hypothetical protein